MINKKIISLFAEKFTPSASRKSSTVVKDITLKPTNVAEVYSKESQIPLEYINENFYQGEEIAPFARRVLNPDLYNMTTGTNRTLRKIEQTRGNISKIKDVKTQKTFEKLYERITNETTNIENLSDGIDILIQKTEMIENPETKELLLSEIESLCQMDKKGFKNNFSQKMQFAEDYLDAVNILHGKYVNMESNPRDLYKWLKKSNSWFLDAIDGKKGTPDNYHKGYASQKGSIEYNKYSDLIDVMIENKIPETYQKNLQTEAFLHFVYKYKDSRPETVKKLYRKEYLPTLEPGIARIFRKINNKFGTYVINSNNSMTTNDARYIQEELKLWKETGKSEAILPEIIDVNFLNKKLKQDECSGMANAATKNIVLEDLLKEDGRADERTQTLRHEIQHLHDKNIRFKNSYEEIHDSLKWNINKLLHKKEWKRELKNGEVPEDNINYGLTNPLELRSVASEADMKKLSDRFKKQLMKKFNMQKWIFDLPENSIRETEVLKNKLTKNYLPES